MKALETTKNRLATATKIEATVTALLNALDQVSASDQTPLRELIEGKRKELEFLIKNKEYNFSFVGGGWNSVYAQDKEEAIKIACEKYNETEQRFHCEENGGGAIPLMKVNEDSFRVATEADTKALLSLFY